MFYIFKKNHFWGVIWSDFFSHKKACLRRGHLFTIEKNTFFGEKNPFATVNLKNNIIINFAGFVILPIQKNTIITFFTYYCKRYENLLFLSLFLCYRIWNRDGLISTVRPRSLLYSDWTKLFGHIVIGLCRIVLFRVWPNTGYKWINWEIFPLVFPLIFF